MVESILFSLANGVLGKLGSLAVQEIGLALGVKTDLDKLSETLSAIQAVLLDAERQQETNHKIRIWLERLEVVCSSADDVLDEFEILALRLQVIRRSPVMKKVRHLFSSSNPLILYFKMGHKIKDIRRTLNDIDDDKGKYNLSEQNSDKKVMPVWRETYSKVDSFDVIGRDYDEKVIVDHLIMQFGDGKRVPVIPIVGLGGLGKTTLAKTVYNNVRVSKHFELRKWVCVSEDFDVKKIICDIANCQESSFEKMSVPLGRTLSGKRYLLVLDDVWNEDATKWEVLINLLNFGANGSKIVVTTRSPLVASITKPPYTHPLEGLSDEDSLNLLMKHAFGEGQEKKYPYLEEFGKDIAKKCRGVPLAIRTLGSHLNMKTEVSEWLSVRDSEIWNLEQIESDILPVLKLSYDYLPHYLKQCFAICSMFEKDHEYNDTSVIYLWMALRLIESDKKLEPEEVGKKYVTELLSRSFFQDYRELYNDEVQFKMHDLMHDLAISVTETDCSRLSHDTPNLFVDPKVRHLSFYKKSLVKRDEIQNSIFRASNMRMIRGGCNLYPDRGQYFVNTCTSKFKFLRVLDMKGSSIRALPCSIGGLKHLRYLDLYICIKLLPNDLCKLQSLQYLQLMSSYGAFDKLPKNFGDLISLRYLKVATNERCFPRKGIGSLTCLRTLIVQRCNNLEYLFDDDYDRNGWMQRKLPNLRNLVIEWCPKLVCLPRSLRLLSSLEALRIASCEELELAKNDESQEIGNLVSLQVLVVEYLPKLVAFPPWLPRAGVASTCLKKLAISDCANFNKLPEDLRHLQKLTIKRCPRLTSFSDSEGSNPLAPTLRELEVRNCPGLERYKLKERHKISYIPVVRFLP